MKKFLNKFTAIALAVVTAATFSACGDDEPEYKEPTVTEATLTTTLYMSKGLMDVIYVTVTNAAGEQLKFESSATTVNYMGENITAYPLKVSSKSNKLDIEQELHISYALKDGSAVPDKFDDAIIAMSEGQVKYSDGQVDNPSFPLMGLMSKGVMGSRINDYIDYLNKNINELESKLDKNGLDLDF